MEPAPRTNGAQAQNLLCRIAHRILALSAPPISHPMETSFSSQQGRKVFAAANEPKKLLIVPHGTHWLANENGYLDTVANFIITNLQTNNK